MRLYDISNIFPEFKIFLEQIDINTKQPTTTWMAAFSEIIQPHSKDIAWEVHASLSRFREVCLDDALETYNKEIQEDVQKRNLGGLESTFLAQRAPSHICMRHLFRTRLGEITSKMSYHSPKQMFFIKHILDGIGTGQEKFSAFYENVNTIFVGILYTLNCPKYSMIAAEPIIKDTWGEISDVSKTVTYVYENIKKEQISAIALAEWETDFCKRNSLLNREHFKSLYKEARSTNPSNKQEWHLNKKGVVLLLSDLSVLKYNR